MLKSLAGIRVWFRACMLLNLEVIMQRHNWFKAIYKERLKLPRKHPLGAYHLKGRHCT